MAKSVVVVGGSLAGLMHGLQHKRLGNNVTILEKDPSERSGHEAGIGFGDAVNDFYKKYDATGLQVAIPIHARRIAYYSRPEVFQSKKPLSLTSWAYFYNLLRANFDGLESAACPSPPAALPGDGQATYLSGKKVVALEYTHTPTKAAAAATVRLRFVDVVTNKEDSLSADLVIGADGIHSTIRQLVRAPTVRRYAGYVSWRGTVSERELSKETRAYFTDWLCLNATKNGYLIGYVVPTDDGNFTPGERLVNFVWYYNLADCSAEMDEIFLDVNGVRHRNTVPRGLVRAEIWEKFLLQQQINAGGAVAPPFAEVLEKVKSPFVTKINDAISGKASFYDGQVVLVGDAFASFRPHAAAATEQCAFHSHGLESVYAGRQTHAEWEQEARRYARYMALLNRIIGDFGRGAVFNLIGSLSAFVVFLLWQRLMGRKRLQYT